MKKWTSVMALAMAGVFAATMAFAQGSGTDATKPTDPMKSGDTKTGDAKKSADTMKSDGAAGKSGKMAKGAGRENVRAAQQALKDKGMDPGPVDGMMGPKTKAALRDYQKKEGLKETGRLDAETMAKLGVEAKTSAGAPDTGSPAASPPTGKDATGTKDAPKNGAAKPDAKK